MSGCDDETLRENMCSVGAQIETQVHSRVEEAILGKMVCGEVSDRI